jgi:hypothetical protein
MAERPTPASTRREGIPARSIRLTDGDYWDFARPTVRLTPSVATEFDQLGRPVDRVTVGIGFGHPPKINKLVSDLRAACENGPVSQQYEAFFSLAATLLRRAHDIDLAAACELLAVSEEELCRLVTEVMAVALEVQPPSEENSPE